MIDTSTVYKSAVKSQGRRTAIRLRLPTVSDGVVLTSTGANRVTQRSDLPTSDSVPNIARLNGSWSLPNKTITSINANELGIISQALTGTGGAISGFAITLSKSGEAFDFLGFNISFKNALGERPLDFTVQVNHAVSSATIYTLTNYASDFWSVPNLHVDVLSIVIRVTKWSVSNSHVKIASIGFGEDILLTDDSIISCNLIESIGYDNTTGLPALASNTLECRFDKRALQGYTPAKYLKIWAEIGVCVDDTTIEYIPCGCFYIDTFEISDYDLLASVKAFDVLYGWGEDTWYCNKINRSVGSEGITKQRFSDLIGNVNFIGDYSKIYTYDGWLASGNSYSTTLADLMLYSNTNVFAGKHGTTVIKINPTSQAVIDITNDNIYDVKKIADYSIKKIDVESYYGVLSGKDLNLRIDGGQDGIEGDVIIDINRPIWQSVTGVSFVDEENLEWIPVEYTAYLDCIQVYTDRGGAYDISVPQYTEDETLLTTYNTFINTARKGLELSAVGMTWFYLAPYDMGVAINNWGNDFINISGATRYAFEITWRGNPALELGDKVRFEDKNGVWRTGYIYDNQYSYEGYLKCKTIIRSDS